MSSTLLVHISTALLAVLWIGLVALGVALLRQKRWLAGGALLFEVILGAATQLALSLVPVGIGEPLIRIGRQALWAWGGAGLVVALVVALTVWGKPAFTAFTKLSFVRSAVPLLTPLLAAGSLYGLTYISTPLRERERDPNRRDIHLPAGFHAEIYASSQLNTELDNPTTMTFAPDGTLFVADIAGNVWRGQDADGDGKLDALTKWAEGFSLLLGLAWKNDELYISSLGKVEALKDSDGDGRGDGPADARRVLAEGLPSMVLSPHSNNSLTFGPDGRLYFGVGATSDDGVETRQFASAIVSISPDGGDAKVFARGFGNPFEVAFNSRGDMFAGDNSGQNGPDGAPAPDEFNHVQQGQDYGFVPRDPLNQAGKTAPTMAFEPHSTPTGLTFYDGKAYPPEFLDNAFIALWNKGDVIRIRLLPNGQGGYTSVDSVFGSGFLYPIDIVVGPDGNLYIADFGTSVVYRVTYAAQ
jgi:putative membrane-bound dehydrogenase-like protein